MPNDLGLKRRSRPEVTRQGPPGKVYNLPSIRMLVLTPLALPDLRPSDARAALVPHGIVPGQSEFAQIWNEAASIGEISANRLLECINDFRTSKGASFAQPSDHIVCFDSYIVAHGRVQGGSEEYFDNVRAVSGVEWSNDALDKILNRKFLIPAAVAQNLAPAATGLGVHAAMLPARPNSCGEVPCGSIRREIVDFLLARAPLNRFPF